VEKAIQNMLIDASEGLEEKVENLEDSRNFNDIKYFDEETTHDIKRMKSEMDKCGEEYRELKITPRNENENESKAKWRCHMCNKTFKFIRQMQKHYISDHQKLDCFKCNFCDFETKSNASLTKHQNTHTKEQVYFCDECDKRYLDNSDLIKHKASHAGSVQCDACNKSLKSTFYLNRHMRIMHSIKEDKESYVCDVCPSIFKFKEYLKRHVKKVHCEYSFMCSMCDKKFKTKYHLTQHELLHTGELKTSECKICGLLLKGRNGVKSRLTAHMESHTVAGSNIQCENCEYYFRGQTNLTQHKLIHHSQ